MGRRFAVIATLAALSGAVLPASAGAASFNVTSTADTATPGTLRQAIIDANLTPAADTITFTSSLAVSVNSPLPTITQPVVIDGGVLGTTARVTGSGSYSCAGNNFTFALNDPGAAGSRIVHLPISAVCGRPIQSMLQPPTALRVGPRRTDGSLPVTGQASGPLIDVFTTTSSGIYDNEATTLLGSPVPSNGAFTLVPSPELAPGSAVTATQTDATRTSGFASRAIVPADVSSPIATNAIAISNSGVRIDFNESIAQLSLAATDFQLSIGGVPKPVVAMTASGNSVYLSSSAGWSAGEAGVLALAPGGAVTDLVGNEIIGAPGVKVLAGPGDSTVPVLTRMYVTPKKYCTKKGKKCPRDKAKIVVNVTEDARTAFTVTKLGRRSKQMAKFNAKLEAGRNVLTLKNTVSGRVLPIGKYLVTAVGVDPAKNVSAPVAAKFQISRPRR